MPPLSRSRTRHLAVLIDAENASARMIEPLLNEVAKYGTANVKRIYGDWTTPNLGSWKHNLNKYAIHPVQQFVYTAGKNASDSALIIDAMDLLHSGNVDGFCIVSSDSDFTRLACRIRESGLDVYGFGEKKTPEPFVRACDRFTFVENLVQVDMDEEAIVAPPPVGAQPALASAAKGLQALGPRQVRIIRSAYDALAPEGGWVTLAALGQQILKLSPSFDPRTFGFVKLSALMSSLAKFSIENRTGENKAGDKHLYVRLKI
jgi:uncharacterized LabA/DUF88 family protein